MARFTSHCCIATHLTTTPVAWNVTEAANDLLFCINRGLEKLDTLLYTFKLAT